MTGLLYKLNQRRDLEYCLHSSRNKMLGPQSVMIHGLRVRLVTEIARKANGHAPEPVDMVRALAQVSYLEILLEDGIDKVSEMEHMSWVRWSLLLLRRIGFDRLSCFDSCLLLCS